MWLGPSVLCHPNLSLLSPQWLPESARYDVLSGNQEKAIATLKRIATENGAPMPLGKLIISRQVRAWPTVCSVCVRAPAWECVCGWSGVNLETHKKSRSRKQTNSPKANFPEFTWQYIFLPKTCFRDPSFWIYVVNRNIFFLIYINIFISSICSLYKYINEPILKYIQQKQTFSNIFNYYLKSVIFSFKNILKNTFLFMKAIFTGRLNHL